MSINFQNIRYLNYTKQAISTLFWTWLTLFALLIGCFCSEGSLTAAILFTPDIGVPLLNPPPFCIPLDPTPLLLPTSTAPEDGTNFVFSWCRIFSSDRLSGSDWLVSDTWCRELPSLFTTLNLFPWISRGDFAGSCRFRTDWNCDNSANSTDFDVCFWLLAFCNRSSPSCSYRSPLNPSLSSVSASFSPAICVLFLVEWANLGAGIDFRFKSILN